MTAQQIKDYIEEYYEVDEILLLDEFAPAFMGICQRFNEPSALYDYDKCIEILAAEMGDEETAIEYFDFNIIGAYMKGIPTFLYRLKE
jgi:hypothetical protein